MYSLLIQVSENVCSNNNLLICKTSFILLSASSITYMNLWASYTNSQIGKLLKVYYIWVLNVKI